MSRVLPGHSIPYALPAAEADAWLRDNAGLIDRSGQITVGGYLQEAFGVAGGQTLAQWLNNVSGGNPRPYGIVVDQPGYGNILVWVDATHHVHVVDITNMPIVNGIAQLPYHSPDEGTMAAIDDFLTRLSAGASALATVAVIAGIGLLAWSVLK